MAKTFQEIQTDISYIFRSTIDPDDMTQTTSEEYLNVASSCYTVAMRLLNQYTFDFCIYREKLKTIADVSTYDGVNGQIIDNGILLSENNKPLILDVNGDLLKQEKGTPQKFWFDTDEKVILYPTPDKEYNLTIKYKDMRYFLNAEGEPELEPTPTSTLRMPERLQPAFIDWLKYETLVNYIKNLTKPRYQPLIDEANKLKLAFFKLANSYTEPARMVL